MPGGVRLMSIRDWPDPFPVTFTSTPRTAKSEQDWLHHDGSKPVPGRSGRAGFYRDSGFLGGPGLGRGVAYTAWTAPYWALVTLFAIPVVWRAGRVVAAKRQRDAGLCPTCGYDLRATPDQCPECGTRFLRQPAEPDSPPSRRRSPRMERPTPAHVHV
jgi:hypothetical protein